MAVYCPYGDNKGGFMACFELAVTYAPLGIAGLAACYFDKKIVIVGGFDGTNYHGFAIQSPDGVNWTATSFLGSAINPARAYHAMCILDNRIFISGGYNGAALGDVWMSNDGVQFTRCQANAFPARYGHAMFAHDERLWVVGGYTGAAILSDVWCSYDGVNWKRIVDNQSIILVSNIARYFMGYCTYDNRMWMAGGIGPTGVLQSVFSSVNGMDWVRGQTPADFPALHSCSLTSFNNKMVLIGGDTSAQRGTVSSQLWYSEHGQSWILGCPNVGFNVSNHAAVSVTEQQRLYVGGGFDGTNYSSNIWRTVGEEFLNRAW
jgi:hypothetical protein